MPFGGIRQSRAEGGQSARSTTAKFERFSETNQPSELPHVF
jgi:hypothetical protein